MVKVQPSDYYNKNFSFHNEWCEVAVHNTTDMTVDPASIFHPILPSHLLRSASDFITPELARSATPAKLEHKAEYAQPGMSLRLAYFILLYIF